MIDIIPVILIYSIILGIIIATIYVISKIGLRIKLGYWLLGGYTIFLLGSVILYTFIPTEDLPTESELAAEELRTDIRHQIAYRGVEMETLDEYKIQEWGFDVDPEKTLNLLVQLEYHYFPVLIKEVEEQEVVNITLYYDKPAFDLEAAMGDIEVVDITMENSEIRINPGPRHNYQFAHVAKEFPFTQFSGDEQMGHYMPRMYTGEFVLYVEKPADLQMHIAPSVDYEYVN